MNISTLNYITSPSKVTDLWLTMEQEFIPSNYDEASYFDIINMLALARSGKSATKYLVDNCPYVTISDSKIYVKLNFYVFPSQFLKNYQLSANFGTISEPDELRLRITKDVIFNGGNKSFLGHVFNGSFIPLMPLFDSQGNTLDSQDISCVDGYALLPVSGYCVYAADGIAIGYQHSIEMVFDKFDSEGNLQSISSIDNTIVAKWEDENNELQTVSLKLEIPGCVEAVLQSCNNENYIYDILKCAGTECDGRDILKVYFNTCNGDEVGTKWIKNK